MLINKRRIRCMEKQRSFVILTKLKKESEKFDSRRNGIFQFVSNFLTALITLTFFYITWDETNSHLNIKLKGMKLSILKVLNKDNKGMICVSNNHL